MLDDMRRHLIPAVLAATALTATGGAAFAIAGSVSTSPDPLYISRTSPGGLSDHPDTTGAGGRPAAGEVVVDDDRRHLDDGRDDLDGGHQHVGARRPRWGPPSGPG
jgi:hypothetical protein